MNRILSRVAFVTALFLVAIPGFSEAPPSQIDLSKFPATQLDDVVVPLPSEVFNVLDKLGSPNWQGELREPTVKNRGERTQIALLLGAVVAEGFVAVEAAEPLRIPVFPVIAYGQAGKNLRLSEYRSDVVAVAFWASWCGDCRNGLPVLEKLQQQMGADGLRVLSVSFDKEAPAAREVAEAAHVSFLVSIATA